MEGDVEVGRVFEGDAVECEVVGEVGVDKAGDLLAACGAGVFGEEPFRLVGGMWPSRRILAPPCPSMAPSPMMAEPVALRAEIGGRHPAEASLTRPQEAFGELVVIRIARGVEGDAAVDEQGDAGAQRDRPGRNAVFASIGGEFDGVGLGAAVEK